MESLVVVYDRDTRQIQWLMRDGRPMGEYQGNELPDNLTWDEIPDEGQEQEDLYIDAGGRARTLNRTQILVSEEGINEWKRGLLNGPVEIGELKFHGDSASQEAYRLCHHFHDWSKQPEIQWPYIGGSIPVNRDQFDRLWEDYQREKARITVAVYQAEAEFRTNGVTAEQLASWKP